MRNIPVSRTFAAILICAAGLSAVPWLTTLRGHAACPNAGPGANQRTDRDDEDVVGTVTAASPDQKAAEFTRKGPARLEPGMIALAIQMKGAEPTSVAWLELTEVGESSVKVRVLKRFHNDLLLREGLRVELVNDEEGFALLRLGDSEADNSMEIGRRRVLAARRVMDVSERLIEGGALMMRDYLDASARLMAAELATAGDREARIGAIRGHMRRIMFQLGRERLRFNVVDGVGPFPSQDQARDALGEAALLLNRAKREGK